VGALIAYTLVLEIDDIHRFPTVRHFARIAGSYPARTALGGRPGTSARATAIATSGSRFIMPRCGRFRMCPRSRRNISGGGGGKARGSRALVAKELATIVHAVLTKGELFNGTFRGHARTTTKRQQWLGRLVGPHEVWFAMHADIGD
jgi:hypothetical protein